MFKRYVITEKPELLKKFEKYISKINLVTFPELPETIEVAGKDNLAVFYLGWDTLCHNEQLILDFLAKNPQLSWKIIVNAPFETDISSKSFSADSIFGVVPDTSGESLFFRNFMNAFSLLQLNVEKARLKERINVSSNEIEKLTKIGISLSYEKDFNKLLYDILYSAREIACADSGSLYLVEKDESGKESFLRFKISALDLESNEFLLPINKKSIAGYVAFTGKELNIDDVYQIDPKAEFRFNNEYDIIKKYHTKSMLTVPMMNHRDEVVGVIQLINKKKHFKKMLTLEEMKGNAVFPFDDHTKELVTSLAGQAAVAIENNNLLKEIETLFEGFVTASVSAIESRDPTTSGHSFRVAEMTVRLAEVVDRVNTQHFKNLKFSKEQIREIRYASLLHDFGKVGVREKVLVKAKKLEEYEMELIHWRFQYIIKDMQARIFQRKIDYLKTEGKPGFKEFEAAMDREFEIEKLKMEELFDVIIAANEPSVLEESNSKKLIHLTRTAYTTLEGRKLDMINQKEFRFLSINKGSLDPTERKEIESHVEHTFQFLSKIPWTGNLRMVPEIAHAHHEKLTGHGYPNNLTEDQIPIQSKMMTIADIFDALTDSDRPYKKAVPLERALDILKLEQKNNNIDGKLLDIFIQERVFDVVLKKDSSY